MDFILFWPILIDIFPSKFVYDAVISSSRQVMILDMNKKPIYPEVLHAQHVKTGLEKCMHAF